MIDGAILGHICDICIDSNTGCIAGFYVPQNEKGISKLFGSSKQSFIPAKNVCRIGLDVIFVEMSPVQNGQTSHNLVHK